MRPRITEIQGDKIKFADKTEVKANALIYATGYNYDVPFLDLDRLNRTADSRCTNTFFRPPNPPWLL
jgi:hypothetical protein